MSRSSNKSVKNIYLTNRFFALLAGIALLFVVSFLYHPIFHFVQVVLAVFGAVVLFDTLYLFAGENKISASREVKAQLHLGEDNLVRIIVQNKHTKTVNVRIIDELPVQFQIRDFNIEYQLPNNSSETSDYYLKPVKRGVYEFGALNIYVSSFLKLVERKFQFDADFEAKVYPSVRLMRSYELKVFNSSNLNQGMKLVRQLGNAQEFEQIKPYVRGDDFRKINWKATSRKNQLMVNQFQDERSQSVYTIIDKSRVMKMPFNDMTLLDHAINSSLVISNIALRKDDKVGLMTYSDKLGVHIKAEKLGGQLRKLLENLYRQKTRYNDANYDLLYYGVRNNIKGRSLLLMYTNFESVYALKRALPVLRKIAKMHLLVVVFFENTELIKRSEKESENVADIYEQVIAQKAVLEKRAIAAELKKYAINTILTTPEKLNVDTINRYLELKARGAI